LSAGKNETRIMKHIVTTLLLLLATAGVVAAQRATPDELVTAKGNLSIQPVEHASLVLSLKGTTIYTDPTGAAAKYAGLAAPDLILITDIHGDHLDTSAILALQRAGTVIVAPEAVAALLPAAAKKHLVVLHNGQSTKQKGISIKAIPMYNIPNGPDARHPKGRGNGYVLNIGGKNIYISGDTQDTPEMRGLKNIDVAFVCMNLPYTMDVEHAASGVLAFAPGIVYPYHYRGQNGLSDINQFKQLVNAGNKNIEVRLRNWYPQP
jgi:L-ascorbate metabolism protein UlaG (beta-lactamase superfamily)